MDKDGLAPAHSDHAADPHEPVRAGTGHIFKDVLNLLHGKSKRIDGRRLEDSKALQLGE